VMAELSVPVDLTDHDLWRLCLALNNELIYHRALVEDGGPQAGMAENACRQIIALRLRLLDARRRIRNTPGGEG
jgi:hypothetical protein